MLAALVAALAVSGVLGWYVIRLRDERNRLTASLQLSQTALETEYAARLEAGRQLRAAHEREATRDRQTVGAPADGLDDAVARVNGLSPG